ncbi:MAG: hypothetical protein RR115_09245, partial [Hydrogenoanaerobacterium sp.]
SVSLLISDFSLNNALYRPGRNLCCGSSSVKATAWPLAYDPGHLALRHSLGSAFPFIFAYPITNV